MEEEEEALEEEDKEQEDNLQNLPYNLKTHKMEVSTITDKHRMVQ